MWADVRCRMSRLADSGTLRYVIWRAAFCELARDLPRLAAFGTMALAFLVRSKVVQYCKDWWYVQ